MTWTQVNGASTTWANSSSTVPTWSNSNYSLASNTNSNRMIVQGDRQDAQGGVDFKLQIRSSNYFVITSLDPRSISETTLNDPA